MYEMRFTWVQTFNVVVLNTERIDKFKLLAIQNIIRLLLATLIIINTN